MFFFHNAKELVARGRGPYFYLPKMESHLEARLWNDVFNFAQDKLGLPRGAIRATVPIETIPAAFEAEGDTYAKFPDDDTYQHLMVNYIKLERLPGFDEDWTPIVKAMRTDDFFVTSGEVLFKSFGLEGSGDQRTIVAELEWTFPLEFVEVVWGDGQKTERQIIPATDLPPFGSRRFRIPFDAKGKKWVRFAAWDAAGNGATGSRRICSTGAGGLDRAG